MSVVTVGVGELAELIWDHRTLVQSPASPFTICTTSDKPKSEKWRWRTLSCGTAGGTHLKEARLLVRGTQVRRVIVLGIFSINLSE